MEESANTASSDDPDPNPMPETATGQQTSAGGEGSSSTEAQEAKFAAEKKEKARVRFNSNAAVTVPPPALTPAAGPPVERPISPAPKPATKPRPSALRSSSANAVPTVRSPFGHEPDSPSYAAAQERAREIAAQVRAESPWDSRASVGSSIRTGDSDSEFTGDDIPLKQLHARPGSRQDSPDSQTHHTQTQSHEPSEINEAQKIVQAHSQRFAGNGQSPLPIHKATPEDHDNRGPSEVNDGFMDDMYHVPPPDHYRGSILSQLLRLYKQPQDIRGEHHQSRASLLPLMGERSGGESRPESGTATPSRRKWYDKNHSQETLANLVEASTRLANPNSSRPADTSPRSRSPFHRRAGSSSRMSQYWMTEEARVTARIAEMLSRQDYLIKLCRALMLFGAPTHRLEEYLRMSARVLEVAGQFLYLPGCMIVSFDDKTLHTTEVRIVRTAQDIDLGKLKDVHEVYKEVMHDVIDVEEGIQKLDALLNKKSKFGPWARVLAFGLTSATCGPFSFKARLIDLPLIFCFGCLVGTLQLIVSPRSALYSNVFEVTSTIIVSFLARAFGSIKGGNLFCFSALAQSGIVMLLPGYLVLCSALEIQSHAIVPGSIRMVYAVIYSLLLGFGIMIGTALYGIFDDSATSATTCENPIPAYWGFIFVPLFAVCISIIYQAKWRQMPVMVIMAFAGYIVNYFSGIKFVASPQIAPTLGALAVGLLANLWSRIRHGVAAATLIPAIFCQVPGGLASTGGLLSGLATADSLRNSSASLNGTDSLTSTSTAASSALNNMVFDVAARMIQIAIGISVGLFISALLVWPLGKRRSGLFSF